MGLSGSRESEGEGLQPGESSTSLEHGERHRADFAGVVELEARRKAEASVLSFDRADFDVYVLEVAIA